MSINLKNAVQKISLGAAGVAAAAAATLVPGIVADSLAPVPQDAKAGELLKSAILPDRTVGAFVDAKLDGSGQTNVTAAVARGLKEDVFELLLNPGKVLVVLAR